jgi:hypothetical protein
MDLNTSAQRKHHLSVVECEANQSLSSKRTKVVQTEMDMEICTDRAHRDGISKDATQFIAIDENIIASRPFSVHGLEKLTLKNCTINYNTLVSLSRCDFLKTVTFDSVKCVGMKDEESIRLLNQLIRKNHEMTKFVFRRAPGEEAALKVNKDTFSSLQQCCFDLKRAIIHGVDIKEDMTKILQAFCGTVRFDVKM